MSGDDEPCVCDEPICTASLWCNNCGGRLTDEPYWAASEAERENGVRITPEERAKYQ